MSLAIQTCACLQGEEWVLQPQQGPCEGQASQGQGSGAGLGLDLANCLDLPDFSSNAVPQGAVSTPEPGWLLPALPSASSLSLSSACFVFLIALTARWNDVWPVSFPPFLPLECKLQANESQP